MKLQSKSKICLAILPFAFYGQIHAVSVALGPYANIGGDSDDTFTGAGNTGGTIEYGDNTARGDIGIGSNFSSPSFTTVGDKLTYTFQYNAISNTANRSNTMRAGIDFGTDDSLHFVTGYGATTTDGRFSLANNGNFFSGGATQGTASGTWATDPLLRFATGNVIDVMFCLTLSQINSPTSFDYTYDVTYTNGAVSNTISQLFAGVKSDTPTGVYHLTNTSAVEVDGETWTVGNAELDFNAVPEPSSLLFGSLSLGLLVSRRKRS